MQEWKVLAKVAASANSGPCTTAIQESVFSRAAAAELGKSASRTTPTSLSLRVFNVMNKSWRDPIKGSKTPLYTLKRKNVQVHEDVSKRHKPNKDPTANAGKVPSRKQLGISAFLSRT